MANSLDCESTNNVTLKGLKVAADGSYPTNATVVIVELLDATNTPVAGVSNIACPYVSGVGSASIYRGTIPSTVTLIPGAVYTARVRATAGSNVRMWNEQVAAVAAA